MSNQLPAILNVNTIPTINNMEIKTEILDPITATNSEVVFQIPKNGILDGGSFVSLAVRTANGVSDAFLPVSTGIHALVKHAELLVGSKVVASIEDFGHYQTMLRQFETPEHRAYVEAVKVGNSIDRFCEVDDATGRILPQDLEYTTFANDNTARAVVSALSKPTDNDDTTPVYCVPLSTLIPFMRSRQLPLFAMKENVFIRIQFNSQSAIADGTICCFPTGSGSNGVVVPSLPNIKFYSDHLYYKDGSMEQTQKSIYSEKGLSYLYEDSILTNASIPSTANPTAPAVQTQKVERDIAVAGRVVRNLMLAEKESGAVNKLKGLYFSDTQYRDDEYNFRINDQRYYDRDISNPSLKYNELSKVLGKPLQVPSVMYSFDADANKDRDDRLPNQNSFYLGQIESVVLPSSTNTNLDDDLRGKSHYVGVDLTTSGFNVLGNGKQIGVKPIIYSVNKFRSNGKNGARELRCYANVERLITIKNGDVVVSA
jgi:hypothetical protein